MKGRWAEPLNVTTSNMLRWWSDKLRECHLFFSLYTFLPFSPLSFLVFVKFPSFHSQTYPPPFPVSSSAIYPSQFFSSFVSLHQSFCFAKSHFCNTFQWSGFEKWCEIFSVGFSVRFGWQDSPGFILSVSSDAWRLFVTVHTYSIPSVCVCVYIRSPLSLPSFLSASW